MQTHEKMTVPNPSAPTDGEQSFRNEATDSIAQFVENCNTELSEEEYDCFLSRIQDPSYLPTMSMQELYCTTFAGRLPVIDGLLHTGAYLLVGAPKVGKSFLVAQIAYHVSTGQPLWGYPVRQGTVLYLALEDDYQRLQSRLFRMFGSDTAEKLHFAIASKQLGKGLAEQLNQFVQKHPDTCLVIIDTLQRIRESADNYSYANDYEAAKQLHENGCHEIYFDIGTNRIEFVLGGALEVGWGIALSLDGKNPPEVNYMTECVPMQEAGWFYYVSDFNKWRIQQKE